MGASLKRSLGMVCQSGVKIVCMESIAYNRPMLNGKLYTKRCRRHNLAGHAHELTFSCYNNKPFLVAERTCKFLVESVIASRKKHEFDLWAYVFMPNHAHLLICPSKEEYSISDILLSIKQPVSRKAINYLRTNDPKGLKHLATSQKHRPYRFWQKGGGYDRNITKVQTIIDSTHYIHNNPVRKELVETPDQWYYSSFADWQGIRQGPLAIDFESFPT
jgi:putative transposase